MRNLGKTILNGLLLGAAAGALTVGFASKSYADAVAFSTLNISNFVVLDSAGNQFNAGDFDVLTVGNFTKSESALDGSGDVSTSPNNAALVCQGDCGGIGENDFSQQPLGSQFSRADAVLSGSAISPGGANSSTVAEVQLNSDNTGTAGSNTGTGTEFSFNLAEDGPITFEFNADAVLRAMLTDPGVMAFAGVAWSLGIVDPSGDTIFSFVPNGSGAGDPCSLNTSRTVLSPGDDTYTCSGAFSFTTGPLDNDTTYRLVINHESSANAELVGGVPVPEPAAAGLLGLGLLGLARLRRRLSR